MFAPCRRCNNDFERAAILESERSAAGDISLATIYTTCLLLGTLSNILALTFFLKQQPRNHNKRYFRYLYITIIATDILVCSTVFPMVHVYLGSRDPGWFSSSWFCYSWAILWEILPSLSVALVSIRYLLLSSLL